MEQFNTNQFSGQFSATSASEAGKAIAAFIILQQKIGTKGLMAIAEEAKNNTTKFQFAKKAMGL